MPPATDSGTALKNLQGYQASIQTPQQVADSANKALGVDSAQANVQGLRGAIQRTTGLLNQVAPSVYGRTGNSLVTSAQATRQIGNESAPIAANLQSQSQDYGNAEQDYQTLLSKSQAQAAGTLQGQQGQLSFLQQIYQNLAQQEQAQKDEAFRQATLAENKRQADLSASTARANAVSAASPSFGGGLASLLGGSGASAKSTPQTQLMADIQRLITPDYATRFNDGYTERQIERLKQAYPEIAGDVSKSVYDYRKQYER